jgi:hypothetical protein
MEGRRHRSRSKGSGMRSLSNISEPDDKEVDSKAQNKDDKEARDRDPDVVIVDFQSSESK